MAATVTMAPRVINLRHERPGDGVVVVDRTTKWGNPFREGVDGTREEVIRKYKELLEGDPEMIPAARRELAGKDLACWCTPLPCHADVLLAVANGVRR